MLMDYRTHVKPAAAKVVQARLCFVGGRSVFVMLNEVKHLAHERN